MSRCDAELCSYWTGQGCICDVLDLRDDEEAMRAYVSRQWADDWGSDEDAAYDADTANLPKRKD